MYSFLPDACKSCTTWQRETHTHFCASLEHASLMHQSPISFLSIACQPEPFGFGDTVVFIYIIVPFPNWHFMSCCPVPQCSMLWWVTLPPYHLNLYVIIVFLFQFAEMILGGAQVYLKCLSIHLERERLAAILFQELGFKIQGRLSG